MKLLYQQNFDLQEAPFSIAPDPRFLYFSRQHQEALAHLKFGLESAGGFVLLTGEIGAGKTTLCRLFLQQIDQKTEFAFIINPMLTPAELVQTICEELGIGQPAGPATGTKPWLDRLNTYLLEAHQAGRSVILVIDEAQNLSREALEQTRLLTNLETNKEKLLRIVLLGQPELAERLAQPDMAQLAQRITVRYHLESLRLAEVYPYLKHRFSVAGGKGLPFTKPAVWQLARSSQCIPRKLNVLADRALLGAYAQSKDKVTYDIARQAGKETQRLGGKRRFFRSAVILASLVVLSLAASLALNKGWLNAISEQIKQTQLFVAMMSNLTGHPVITHASSYEKAFQKLFAYWHTEVDAQPEPCGVASQYGLACLEMEGDWALLLKINRPALLAIRHPETKQTSWLPVVAGTPERFAFDSRQKRTSLDVALLKTVWTGHFRLLWQLPPQYKQPFSEGTQSVSVTWLRHQLSALGYAAAPEQQAHHFDPALTRQLKRFQGDRGLKVNGIAGPLTLIAINSSNITAIPKLRESSLGS